MKTTKSGNTIILHEKFNINVGDTVQVTINDQLLEISCNTYSFGIEELTAKFPDCEYVTYTLYESTGNTQ